VLQHSINVVKFVFNLCTDQIKVAQMSRPTLWYCRHCFLNALKAICMLHSSTIQYGIYLVKTR